MRVFCATQIANWRVISKLQSIIIMSQEWVKEKKSQVPLYVDNERDVDGDMGVRLVWLKRATG